MRSIRLASRRSGAQAGLLATVGAVSLVLTALVVGLIGYLDFSATVTTRAFLEHAEPTTTSLRIEAKLAADPGSQNKTVETFLHREFAGIPVTVTRTAANFPLPATHNGEELTYAAGNDVRITTAADADVESHATLVDGQWPTASSANGSEQHPFSGALQADAAKQLGLAVGDTLLVGKGSEAKYITVTATWLPKNVNDARWFSDPGVATGNAIVSGDGTPSLGPLVVDEQALASLGPLPSVHWVIALNASEVTPAQLEKAGIVATNLSDHAVTDETMGSSLLMDGTLAHTATTVHTYLESVRGVTPVGTLLVALIGLIALVQLARLLSLARRPENALLRSRGASAGWLTTAGTVEAAIVAVLGCGLGFTAALFTLIALFGPSVAPFLPWELAALSALAVLAIFGVTALLDSLRLAKRDAVDDSGRTREAAKLGTAVLAIAAAGVAVWQSLLYGSPLVTDAAGRTSVNPLAVVAPTLALIAVALVVLVLFGPLTAAWLRFAARRPGLQPAYSSRQIARGLGSYAVAVLVVVLAVGGVVVASGYSGTWKALSTSNGELVIGADARITLTTSNFPLAGPTAYTGAEFLTVAGVTAAAPVFSTPLALGDNDGGALVAIPREAIEPIMMSADGAVDTAAVQSALEGYTQHGVEFPVGTTSVTLQQTVSVTGNDFSIPTSTWGFAQSTLWFQNSNGAIISVENAKVVLNALEVGENPTASITFELPASHTSWWLTAIDTTVKGTEMTWVHIDYHDLEATTASGTSPVAFDVIDWGNGPSGWASGLATFASAFSATDGVKVGVPGAGSRIASARLMPQDMSFSSGSVTSSGGQLISFGQPLLMVVTEQLATHYDLKNGSDFQVRFEGSGLTLFGVVAAIVPAVPGAAGPQSVLVDLNALNDYILRISSVSPGANQIWLSTRAPENLQSALPPGATLTTPAKAIDTGFSAPAERALWIAAIGCLGLAAISLGAVTLTLARSRRGEIAVLRAVGIAARRQSRWRWGELSAIILLSVVFGVLGGLAVSALTVANLARSAVQDASSALPTTLAFALTAGGALVLCSLAVMLTIALVSASRVRRTALNTSERLETR